MTMLVRASGEEGGGRLEEEKAMHSHLSSNYTTTLIPLGLELIARVRTLATLVAPACSGPITTPITLGDLHLRRGSGPAAYLKFTSS